MKILLDFPPAGCICLEHLLPKWPLKDFIKGVVGLFGLTQQTAPSHCEADRWHDTN
ncbi:hypothetical protein [Hymenobacter cellulosivorans]|uniref:Uncharacterized protein n=1 Tax=Hymenobacter cellulosivorans TaxID=2932249 RepID=A0ABY4F5C0_9BACT|nr:hypothetical protein [Hymenobacter cellulosivorans]UOQ51718.1 hypothetical protein MUN80_18375 [Hymenobacter cellulosivorans]